MTLIITKKEVARDSDQEPIKPSVKKSRIPVPRYRSPPIRRVVGLTTDMSTDQTSDQTDEGHDVVLFEYEDEQSIENTDYQGPHQSFEQHNTVRASYPLNTPSLIDFSTPLDIPPAGTDLKPYGIVSPRNCTTSVLAQPNLEIATDHTNGHTHAGDDVASCEYEGQQIYEDIGYQGSEQSTENADTQVNVEASDPFSSLGLIDCLNLKYNFPADTDSNINPTSSPELCTAGILDLEYISVNAVKEELLTLKKSIEKSVRNLEAENKIQEINIVQASDKERGRESYRIFEKCRRFQEYNEKMKMFERGECEEEEVRMAKARADRYLIRGNMDMKEMRRQADQAQKAFAAAAANRREANAALEESKIKKEEAEASVKAAHRLREETTFLLNETKREKAEANVLLRKAGRYKLRGEGFFQQASGYKEVADKELEEAKKYQFFAEGTMQRATQCRVQAETYEADATGKLREVRDLKAAVSETLEDARYANTLAKKRLEEAKKIEGETKKNESSKENGQEETLVCENLTATQTKKNVAETDHDHETPGKDMLLNTFLLVVFYVAMRFLISWSAEDLGKYSLRFLTSIVVVDFICSFVIFYQKSQAGGKDEGDKK